MELINLKGELAKVDKNIATSVEISFPEYLVGVDEKGIMYMNIYFINNQSYDLKRFDVSYEYHIKMQISNVFRKQDILLLVFINKDPGKAYGFDSFGKMYRIDCNEEIREYLDYGKPITYNGSYYFSILKEDYTWWNGKIRFRKEI